MFFGRKLSKWLRGSATHLGHGKTSSESREGIRLLLERLEDRLAPASGTLTDYVTNPNLSSDETSAVLSRTALIDQLPQIVAQAEANQPNRGRGASFSASMPALPPRPPKPDLVLDGEEGEGGFEEGPEGTQSEMSIAVDATGNHIVVGFNDFRGFDLNPTSTSGFAYSDDGGLTFTDGGQLPTNTNGQLSGGTKLPQVAGDPDVKYVPGGAGLQFIYASIEIKGIGVSGSNFAGTAQTLCIHRSIDGGHTWSGPFEVTPATNPNGVLVGANARDVADKEFIDVNPTTGRVIISWSNFTNVSGIVEISTAYSNNIMTGSPPTWSGRTVLNPGRTTFDTGSMPRFVPGLSNEAYVVWSTASFSAFANNIAFSRSSSNGTVWSAPQKLNAADFFSVDQILGNDRINSFPAMDVDKSGGPNNGHIYVAYARNDNKDGGDIAFQRSVDGGVNFSAPVLLNSRPAADRSQWFPYVSVDQSTGRVSVIYFDQGIATSGDLTEVTWIYSDDGGTTWSKPSPLTDRPFHAGYGNDTSQPNLGDYLGTASQGGDLYAAFPAIPNVALFTDGEPTDTSFPYPSFLPNTSPGAAPGFRKVSTGKAALRLGALSFTESGGNGFIDPGETINFQVPLTNYVTNTATGTATYTGVSATLSSSTPGVTVLTPASAYPNIGAGATQTNTTNFVVKLAPSFVPGTKIEFSLAVVTAQGGTTLLFTQNTGTPVATTIFSENFDGVASGSLPAGWTTIHAGGNNTVPWTTSSTALGAASNGLFHINANDGLSGNHTRFERVASPNIVIPNNAEYVTLDFDIAYDTENDPNFNVLAYDGADLRITDFTPGRLARTAFVEAYAEDFTTGASSHYPAHLPRFNTTAYLQDISAWAGDSGGFKRVHMKILGMAGSTIQLRPDYTQDNIGTGADVRPTHTSFGVMIDNIVMKSVISAAEMDVRGNSVSISDGDASPSAADGTDFGAVDVVSGSVDHVFTIANTGAAALNLTGTPKVQISGANAADFTVTAQPASPVAGGGGTTTFTIHFDPSALGVRTATVTIANDDPDENPYDFAIQGTGAALDFGDAPSSYPTTLAQNGARHTATGPTLGATRDTEADGQPSADASGDGADEDGVTFLSPFVANGTALIRVSVQNAPANAKLDAWIDWNHDGDWADAGEQIAANLSVAASDNNYLVLSVPAAASVNAITATFARFRLSTAGNLAVTGQAADGEVEDYALSLSPAPATVYVDDNFAAPPGTVIPDADPAQPGNQPAKFGFDAFATLQQAINVVAPGGTVRVADGVYHENVVIKKSVSILGQSEAGAVVAGAGAGTGIASTGQTVTLAKLNVQNFATGLSATSAVNTLNLNDILLLGNGSGGSVNGVQNVNVRGNDTADTFNLDAAQLSRSGEDPLGYSGIANLKLFGLGGEDVFNVNGSAAGTALGLFGDGDNDFFNIVAANGQLGAVLQADVTIDGGGGGNQLNVREAASANGDSISVAPNEINGVGFKIIYTASSGSFGSGIEVSTGVSKDIITVLGTPAFSPLSLKTSNGNDQIDILSPSYLGATLGAPVTIDAGGGGNQLNLSQPGDRKSVV
jgi:hypothetical protein